MKKSKIAMQFFVMITCLVYSTDTSAAVIPQISVKNNSIIALKNDGTIYTWGGNSYGQLGDGTNTTKKTPTRVKDETGKGYMKGIKQVTTGAFHTVILSETGTVYAFGVNNFGELGNGTTANKNLPTKVKDPSGTGYLIDINAIGGGWDHTFAIKSDGTVYGWGSNYYGQLGDNTTTDRKLPVQIKDPTGTAYLSNIKQISGGSYHTVALKSDGTVYAWGNNNNGQLGDGSNTNRKLPVQVKDPTGTSYLTDVKKVAVGNLENIALKNDGTVVTWGNPSVLPITKDSLNDVVDITSGGSYFLALKTDGSLWAWGWNNFGQLGDNTTTSSVSPVQVVGAGGVGYLKDIEGITAGNGVTLAFDNNGNLYSWGDGSYGSLGNNTLTGSTFPIKVLGGESKTNYFQLFSSIFSSINSFISISPGTFTFDPPTVTRGFSTYVLSENYPDLTADLSSVKIVDWSGTGDGWHLSLTASPLTDERGNTLPSNSLLLDAPSSILKLSSNALPLPTVVSSTQLLNITPVTLASASVGKGIGEYSINFNANALHLNFDPSLIKLDSDGTSTFTSTLTWNLSIGP